MYGIGARLDHAPELLFTLRQVDHRALVGAAARGATRAAAPAKNQLATDGLSDIFGIELEAAARPADRAKLPARKKRRAKQKVAERRA
jgi:hypothetical protein